MTMHTRPGSLGAAGRAALVVWALAMVSPIDAGAQSSQSSSMSITVTVTRSCTVEAVAAVALLGEPPSASQSVAAALPAYSIRCGKKTVAYPLQPGLSQAGQSTNWWPAVTRSVDGRSVVIQF
jgi:hypothetical protein